MDLLDRVSKVLAQASRDRFIAVASRRARRLQHQPRADMHADKDRPEDPFPKLTLQPAQNRLHEGAAQASIFKDTDDVHGRSFMVARIEE